MTPLISGNAALHLSEWSYRSRGCCRPPPRPLLSFQRCRIDRSWRNPTTAAPPITADRSHLSVTTGARAARCLQGPGQTERESGCGKERQRKGKKGGDDKQVRRWNLPCSTSAKTDPVLGAACALLILTTYSEIKKRLLTNWWVWINHRAELKGRKIGASWQYWSFWLKWQMCSESRRSWPLSLSTPLSDWPVG